MNDSDYDQGAMYGIALLAGFFFGCGLMWRDRERVLNEVNAYYQELEDDFKGRCIAVYDSIQRLEKLAFNYAKAGVRMSKSEEEYYKTLLKKRRIDLTEEQRKAAEFYESQFPNVNQVVEILEPPDDSGDWIWSEKHSMWEKENGRVRSAGRVTVASSSGGKGR